MANTRILQVFQCDKRDFAGSGRIALPLAGTYFSKVPGHMRQLAVRIGAIHGGGKLLRQTLGNSGLHRLELLDHEGLGKPRARPLLKGR